MRIIKEDARRIYNDQAVNTTTSRTVLDRKQNKIIDADTQQAERLAVRIAEANAAARECAPVIIAREA